MNALSELKKYKAIERVKDNNILTDIYTLEKHTLEYIVDCALACEEPARRWETYEKLKLLASGIAGWEAKRAEFQDNVHFKTLVDFVDWLLPTEGDRASPTYAEMIDADYLEQEEYVP